MLAKQSPSASRSRTRTTACLLLAALSFVSARAFGFITINETGDVIPVGIYKIGVEPQIKISDGSGGNLDVFVDSGINEEWSWRAQAGSGDIDFWLGGSAKWVPIPDYQKQPALGARFEVNFGRDASENFTLFRVAPLVSKSFDTEVGKVTPYAALPLGLWAWKGTSDTTSQFVLGSEGKFEQTPDLLFTAEMGFNLNKTFSYISGSVTYFFNDTRRVR